MVLRYICQVVHGSGDCALPEYAVSDLVRYREV